MYELKLQKNAFYRVKEGQTAQEIENTLSCPVCGEVKGGAIIVVPQGEYKVYSACVGDSYALIAKKFGADEGELIKLNGGKPIYPTCRIIVPCK